MPLRTARNLFYRVFPQLFWVPYAQKVQNLGVEGLYIILSYDCDTRQDADASMKLFDWLRTRNIPATFAVPGPQLHENKASYLELKKMGAQFINHGGADHTQWRQGHYWSVTFYDKMTSADIVNDIRKGHAIFNDVFGEEPVGFRAPHFGHFQEPWQLELIYKTLRSLRGYEFATTTLPNLALRNGPVYDIGGVREIPLMGSYHWPLRVFDSWRYRQDRQSRRVKDDYAREMLATIEIMKTLRMPAILNYYSDPSHVYKNQLYYHALEFAREQGVVFLSYEELLELIDSH